jgi:hypothetical protein
MVRADPAEYCLQRRIFVEPVSSVLILGSEAVDDSGVGYGGEVLGCFVRRLW